MVKNPHKAEAAAIVKGNGTPRMPEQIMAELERALNAAHERGLAAAASQARERALRESLLFARALQQQAASRVMAIEVELAELGGFETVAAWRAAQP